MSYAPSPIVFVVDNDVSVRESLKLLIRIAGWQPETFASAHEFLARPRPAGPCCLILDATLPDINSLELQQRLAVERGDMPIIFLSRLCDVQMTVKAMKNGALEFLSKPFDDQALLNAIRYAIKRSEAVLGRETELHALRTDYGSLTRRERDVMKLVVSGLLNKQVGGELGISEITVKAHRGNVMRKMKANSFAALVNMAARLSVTRPLLTSYASR
jgi:FixJ family two-component response regulator